MKVYDTSVRIDAPADRVWQVLSDVTGWPEWLPTVSRVETEGEGTLAPGARYRVHQPRLRPAVWAVTAVEAGRGFVWQCRGLGVRLLAAHALLEQPSGQTVVRLRFVFDGWLGHVLGIVTGRLTREYLKREASALKAWVEQAPA